MEKKWNVLWTEKSIEVLVAIKSFISRDSVARAEEWVEELYSVGISLTDFPTRGRIVPEFNHENLREILIENYRLVYRIKKMVIEIVTVFEGHRQLRPTDLKK